MAKGFYKNFWEMRRGTPKGPQKEIFKCTHCGGETTPSEGFNGEPSVHNCHPGCPCRNSGWKPANKQSTYDENFKRTFPNAPDPGF